MGVIKSFSHLAMEIMKTEPNDSIFDRFGIAFIGALTGAAYGVHLSFMVLVIDQHFYVSLIVWPAVVFAVVGFFFENIILNIIVALFSIRVRPTCIISHFPDTFSSLSPKDPSSKNHFWLWVLVGIEILVAVWFLHKHGHA